MTNIYYREQVLENIARKVLCGYDYRTVRDYPGSTGQYAWLRHPYAHRPNQAVLLPAPGRPSGRPAHRRYGQCVSGVQTGHAHPAHQPPTAVKFYRYVH